MSNRRMWPLVSKALSHGEMHPLVKFLKLYLVELESDEVIPSKYISYVLVGKNKDGQDKKAPSVEFKQTPARDLIAYLKPKLTEFITHNFLA